MNKSTLVPREEISDLDWLARNVHEWPYELQTHCYVMTDRGGKKELSAPACSPFFSKFTKDQWLGRRAELQNKPSWGAVPINANWIAQDAAGTWIWHWNKPEHRNGMWINGDTRGYAAKGAVLGDWRDTLEKRPDASEIPSHSNQPKPSTDIQECAEVKQFEPFVSVEDAATAKQPASTPSKYTKTIHGVSVDVYDVLQAWGVSNPALQHLIKKALQCGRRGHKDSAQDLQDIIDSAIRAKELEC